MARNCNWMLTSFDEKFTIRETEPLQFWTGQWEECPKTQKKHLQAYLEFNKRMTIKTIKAFLQSNEIHLEIRRGSQEDAIAYCTKEETRVDGPYDWGVKKEQGKRNDLINAMAGIRMGKKVIEVIEDSPNLLTKYKCLQWYEANVHNTEERNWVPEVTVLTGEPGTGKSRYAHDNEPDLYVVPDPSSSQFFDGYRGQDAVLFDDFEGSIKYRYFLQLIDRYKMQVNIKGGMVNWKPRRIYITTNVEIDAWYPKQTGGVEALMRRVTKHIRLGWNGQEVAR